MSDSSYSKLRKALDEARAKNASDADLINDLVRTIPVETLKSLYREAVRENRSDLGSAIERALFNPTGSSVVLPAQDGEVAKKATENTVEGAIASAFGPKRSSTTKAKTIIPSADGPRYGDLGGKA